MNRNGFVRRGPEPDPEQDADQDPEPDGNANQDPAQRFAPDLGHAPEPILSQLKTGSWKPEKITGAHIEAKLGDWGRRARDGLAERDERSSYGLVRLAIIGALLLALASVGLYSMTSSSSLQRQSAQNHDQIRALRQKITGARMPQSKKAAVAKLTHLQTTAERAARQVAIGQQQYVKLAYPSDPSDPAGTDPADGNGVPGINVMKMVRHRRDLAHLWSPGSLVVSDEKAYRLDTAASFPPGRIDPRFPWYLRDGRQKPAAPTGYGWSVQSVMPELAHDAPPSQSNLVDVIWVCRENGGPVLAWAKATYDVTSMTFSDLSVVTTVAGAHAQGTAATVHSSPSPAQRPDRHPAPARRQHHHSGGRR